MFSERTSVGLDVHARSVVACGLDTVTGQLYRQRLTPSSKDISRWLGTLPGPVAVAYEAGPTGYGLARFLNCAGVRCVVAAPSKLQRPQGDRVKTDARDAAHLARLLRMDQITAVRIPSPDEEAARDLVRAREDVRSDLMRSRHRVSKLLLRQGIVWSGGAAWTGKHELWLRQQHFDRSGLQLAFDVEFEAVLMAAARRDRLDKAIEKMAADSQYTPVVRRLCCLRGVSTLTGFALAVEVGDWYRFSGSTIGAYLGLVPTERSSGQSRSQGSITKTGNTHARRLLVEAAWHHRKPLPHARIDDAGPLGGGDPGRASARPPGQPTAQGPVGGLHRPEETTRHRQRSDRPGVGRLVLVAGHPRVNPPGRHPLPKTAGRRSGAWQRVEQTRAWPMSSNGFRCHARSLDKLKRSSRTARPAVSNPRISV